MNAAIGAASYAIAAAAFTFLTLLLLVSWRGRISGLLLAGAALISALWSGLLAYDLSAVGVEWRPWSDALEVARTFAWYAFLGSLLRFTGANARAQAKRTRWFVGALLVLCAALMAAAFAGAGAQESTRFFSLRILGHLFLALFGLLLLEQVYVNAFVEQRWALKFLVLGVGGMFAYDFYLYSDALLFGRISEGVWEARGAVNTLVVPLVTVSAARNPRWSLDVAVSRSVIFHSVTLLGAGGYLILMAAAGYYLQFFGGTWGNVLQATFMFAAMLALVALLISTTLRAKLRVFLSKNFFTYKYDYREEWLRFTQILSEGEPGVQMRERAIRAVAGLVDSGGGALWLAQQGTHFELAARWNLAGVAAAEPKDSAFCKALETQQLVVDLAGNHGNRGTPALAAVPEWITRIPRGWLVVPLILHEKLIGFMLLTESRGDVLFNWEVSDLLKTAGRQAASYLAHMEATRALTESRQFDSFTRTTTFVVHDLKNLVAQLTLLLSNAKKHKHSPAFIDDMLETVENAVEKMQRLLSQLRSASTSGLSKLPVDLSTLLQRIVMSKSKLTPAPTLAIATTAVSVLADAERLERSLGNLVQNAIDAAGADGWVTVRLSVSGESVLIEVADNGVGMSEDFIREKLFQPFETTKAAGMGVGAYETREYIRELGGLLEVQSELGRGTTFRVTLPLSTAAASPAQLVAANE